MAKRDDGEPEIPGWIFKAAAALAGAFAVLMLIAAFASGGPDARPENVSAAEPLPGRPVMLVLETSTCGWCRRFRETVAPDYERSRFDGIAPLRYLDLSRQRTAGFRLKRHVSATPTFVLVDRAGSEVARFAGYLPARQFLPEVEKMVAALD